MTRIMEGLRWKKSKTTLISPSRLASSTSMGLGAASATNWETRSPVNKVINIQTFHSVLEVSDLDRLLRAKDHIASFLSFEALRFYLRFAFCARQHVTRLSFLVIQLFIWKKVFHWRKIYIRKMSSTAAGGPRWRNNPFNRDSASPSPGPSLPTARPMSAVLTPSPGAPNCAGHNRNHSFSPLSGSNLAPARTTLQRSISTRNNHQSSSTFAPKFIRTQEPQGGDEHVGGIEGENDFSGKRYVWLRDPQTAFLKGWVVEDLEDGHILVQCDDGSVRVSRY